MAASALSPSSSPRLPSPPPIAEDQLGPKSPTASTEEQQKLWHIVDHGAARRIRPGTKAVDMAEGPPLVDLSEIDSAFQLTEHLKALHNFLTHAPGSDTITPVDREMAHKLAQPPDNVDKTLWLYELCRFLTQKVNSIIVALFFDSPACSATTCPEMRASEWQYLCAVHDPPKSCCAIDYCCHTLDWAANTLTSPKTFPSRLSLGTEPNTQHQQIRQLTNIFRRVYRIFAHAWFQHREMFWKVENRTGLYILFKTVCDVYGLIPEDNYTIPAEAEGSEPSNETTPAQATAPMILKREPSGSRPQDQESSSLIEGVPEHTLSTAGTTKRHRHSPSVGATAVSTVVEEAEEEDQEPTTLEAGQTQTQEPLPETDFTGDHISDPADQDAEADSTILKEPTIGEDEGEKVEETASPPAPEAAKESEGQEKQAGSEDHVEGAKDDEKKENEAAPAVAAPEPPIAVIVSAPSETEGTAEDKEAAEEGEESNVAEPEKVEKVEAEDEPEAADKEKQSGEEAEKTGE